MYSAQNSPTPSTTAVAPEFLTANLSPACPAIKVLPPVAPNNEKLPTNTFSPNFFPPSSGDLITISPPHDDLPTPSLHVPVCSKINPSLQNAAKLWPAEPLEINLILF